MDVPVTSSGTRTSDSRDGSLTRRVFRAGIWTTLFHGLTRGIGFIRNIVLARILSPDDFGLFGITLAVLAVLERFSQTGLRAALVQKEEEVDDYLDSAFAVQAFRGTVLAAILVFGAGYIATFFEEPRAEPLIQLLGASFLIHGFQNVAIVQYTRQLEMRYQYLHRFSSRLVDLVVSVVLAVILRNAWALMIGLVAGRLAALIVSYIVHPYRPKLRFSLSQTHELGRYGRWIFLNNVVGFIAYRGDSIIIGKFLGATSLGIYTLAYSISEVVTVEVSRIMNDVAFPAFARAQGDLARVRRGYFAAIELVTAVSFPAAVGLYLLSVPLIELVLGEGWEEVAFVLPALAIAGALRALVRNGQVVLRGIGKPGLVVGVNVLAIFVTYSAMFLLIPLYGLLGVALAVLLGQAATLPLTLGLVGRMIDAGIGPLARALVPATILSIVVGVVSVGMDAAGVTRTWYGTVFTIVFAVLAFAAAAGVQWRTTKTGPFRILAMMKDRKADRKKSKKADAAAGTGDTVPPLVSR